MQMPGPERPAGEAGKSGELSPDVSAAEPPRWRNPFAQRSGTWKVTTAGAAVAGLGAFGLGLGLSSVGSDAGERPDAITLQERIGTAAVAPAAPAPADGGIDASQLSPDGESFDSPLQSPTTPPTAGIPSTPPPTRPVGSPSTRPWRPLTTLPAAATRWTAVTGHWHPLRPPSGHRPRRQLPPLRPLVAAPA